MARRSTLTRQLVAIIVHLSFLGKATTSDTIILPVGVLLHEHTGAPFDMERVGPALDMAIEKVNTEILNSSYKLEKHAVAYARSCNPPNAVGHASELFFLENVVAFFGPACAPALHSTGQLAGFWNIPVITGLGDQGIFKNKTIYATLTRMSYCQCRLRKVFGSIFRHFNWKHISVLYDRFDTYSFTVGETLDVGLRIGGFSPYMLEFESNKSPNYTSLLLEVSERSRVVILSVRGETLRDIMLQAYDLGMTEGEWVFLDVELFRNNYWGRHTWRQNDQRDAEAKLAYEALLRIALLRSTSSHFKEFEEEVKRRALKDYHFDYGYEEVNYFVGAFYDGVILYGMALNETLTTGESAADGYNFTRRMWNRSFEGISGEVVMDANGDRDTEYSVLDMNPETGEFEIVANYFGWSPIYNEVKPVHWPRGRKEPPPDVPECGFRGEKLDCFEEESLATSVYIATGIAGLIAVAGIASFFAYKVTYQNRTTGGYRFQNNGGPKTEKQQGTIRMKLESDLANMSWRISWDELKFHKGKCAGSSQSLAKISFSARSSEMTIRTNSNLGKEQLFANVATYKGVMVAVKKLNITKLDLTRKRLLWIKRMRDMQHNNIARFIGACVDPPNIAIAMEYCAKGSLQDILENDCINLDWQFRLSIIDDIVSGMKYLHASSIQTHGELRSSNCVCDSRFVIKITDFGLSSFVPCIPVDQTEGAKHIYYRRQLWVAPELLRVNSFPLAGTQKGDVYAFGIILQEIALRASPYEEDCTLDVSERCHSASEIVEKVKAGSHPPYRPLVNDVSVPEQIKKLMQRCWEEDPEDRPSFEAISNILKRHHKPQNIMDSLILRMEQYANNLESIVDERTQQLIDEKNKVDGLLNEILPRSVADQLKAGNFVEPESYESVTIYFSDIVGFTCLSADSSPLQVVNLLNDLYTCFDATLVNYDVYKVETIGDAYMVASGLPDRNGLNHAREIARMSLDVLKTVSTFQIRHRPTEQLKLRIGIHSGSCVAGVVGLKMPRYCLFGDTVNTASRMESTSLPLKIHISSETEELLRAFGNFVTERRGEIDVKGKGKKVTYWLLNEQGQGGKETESQSPNVSVSTMVADKAQTIENNHNVI